jgi:hypothetical protein
MPAHVSKSYRSVIKTKYRIKPFGNFVPLGLNEADTLKCSSVLIYSISDQSIFTKVYGIKPRQLKRVRLKYGGNCSFFTAPNQWGIINFDYEFWTNAKVTFCFRGDRCNS